MKKIVWTQKGNKEFDATLSFWANHNLSTAYSRRLREAVLEMLEVLSSHPAAGKQTNIRNVKTKLVAEHFLLIYRVNQKHISILRFWDTRRDPASLKRYLK